MTPGSLAEIHFQDRNIVCVDCGEFFTWSAGAQQFFADKGLTHEPKRCYVCKEAKNARLAAVKARQDNGVRPWVSVEVTCAECHERTTVPFYPIQGKPVYCRKCFLARSSGSGEVGDSAQDIVTDGQLN